MILEVLKIIVSLVVAMFCLSMHDDSKSDYGRVRKVIRVRDKSAIESASDLYLYRANDVVSDIASYGRPMRFERENDAALYEIYNSTKHHLSSATKVNVKFSNTWTWLPMEALPFRWGKSDTSQLNTSWTGTVDDAVRIITYSGDYRIWRTSNPNMILVRVGLSIIPVMFTMDAYEPLNMLNVDKQLSEAIALSEHAIIAESPVCILNGNEDVNTNTEVRTNKELGCVRLTMGEFLVNIHAMSSMYSLKKEHGDAKSYEEAVSEADDIASRQSTVNYDDKRNALVLVTD